MDSKIQTQQQPSSNAAVSMQSLDGLAIGNGQDIVRRQPLLALSGLGAAVGSVSSLVKRINRISPRSLTKIPKVSKIVPKYLKSKYLKYPAMFIILLASVRKFRSIMNY